MEGTIIGIDQQTKNHIELPDNDRTLGVILAGQTGMGKTNLMEKLIITDIIYGGNAIVFDPHGELAERVLRLGAAFNPNGILFCEIGNNISYGFNPLEMQNPSDPLEESQTIDSLMQVFRKHWSDNPAYSFGSRVEWVLSNTARTILANPGYTLAEIPLLLSDKAFRDKLIRNVVNPQVQFFWGEYRQLESTRRPLDTWQMVESTITRLTQFLANEWLYRVLYQAKGTIKFHELIDSGKTIIFNLPIGKLGEEPASLLGSLLLGKLATTLFGRNEYGKTYPRVHIYIDEYARFSIPMISQLWVQARKFNCGLTATIQTLSQIKDDESRAAILQAGNLIAFQCVGSDADIIAKQMPLPDPVALMKPEPILLYSQTPVEDIWHKGHPNKEVMDMRKKYFNFVDYLERFPQDEYWWLDATILLQQHPDWRIFRDWDMYRSSRDMLKQAIVLLNQYFYNWMEHKYSPHTPAPQEAIIRMVKLVESVSGVMGMRPVMEPFVEETKWRHLLHRYEQNRQHWVAGAIERQEQRASQQNYRGVVSGEAMRNWLREEGFLRPVDENIPNFFWVQDVEKIRKFMLEEFEISNYEVDQLLQWRVRELLPPEQDALTELIRIVVDLEAYPMETSRQRLQVAADAYVNFMTLLGLQIYLQSS